MVLRRRACALMLLSLRSVPAVGGFLGRGARLRQLVLGVAAGQGVLNHRVCRQRGKLLNDYSPDP
jgi:hypothetical protein